MLLAELKSMAFEAPSRSFADLRLLLSLETVVEELW